MNVMKLAWRIYKNNKDIYTFRYALVIAWKICKNGSINSNLEYVTSLSKSLFHNSYEKVGRVFKFANDLEFRLFVHEIRYID